jgi:hypothetical protein
MHAATQYRQGTIAALTGAAPHAAESSRTRAPPGGMAASAASSMPAATPRLFKIQGITRDGKPFRPSDWAERLAGALSSFQPAGAGIGAHIGYSPYCVPRVVGGVKCVIVNEALRALEPMALDFVMNFARDNNLVTSEVAPGEDLS